MNRRDALRALRAFAPTVRAMGVRSLFLFGSTARDRAEAGSDLDLFVDPDPDAQFSLFDLVGLKQFLEEQLHAAVDVTTRSSLHPLLRDDIEANALRVF